MKKDPDTRESLDRLHRGGGWNDILADARVSSRYAFARVDSYNDLGLRLVRTTESVERRFDEEGS